MHLLLTSALFVLAILKPLPPLSLEEDGLVILAIGLIGLVYYALKQP